MNEFFKHFGKMTGRAAIAAFLLTLSSVALAQAKPALVRNVDRTAPSNIVTVRTYSAGVCTGGFAAARAIDTRIMSDGSNVPFVIPSGQVFVVTSIEASLNGAASENTMVRIGTGCGAGCMVPFADIIIAKDSAGQGGTNLNFTTGFTVKSGTQLCVADVNHSSPNTSATLRGYFANDE
jgi:hypothetical protein